MTRRPRPGGQYTDPSAIEALRRITDRRAAIGAAPGQDSVARYGRTRVATIKAAYDDLRKAIRAHDMEAAEAALDRYEQWADYVFHAP